MLKFVVGGDCAPWQKENQSVIAKTVILDDHVRRPAHGRMAKFAVGMENVVKTREQHCANATKILQARPVQRHAPETRMAQSVMETGSVC